MGKIAALIALNLPKKHVITEEILRHFLEITEDEESLAWACSLSDRGHEAEDVYNFLEMLTKAKSEAKEKVTTKVEQWLQDFARICNSFE